MNIRNKLFLYILAPVSILLLMLLAGSNFYLTSFLEERAEADLVFHANELQAEYEHHIRHCLGDLQVILGNEDVGGFCRRGKEGAQAGDQPGLARVARFLLNTSREKTEYASLSIYEANGQPLLSVVDRNIVKPDSDRDLTDQAWFRRTLSLPNGKTLVSSVSRCPDHGSPEIILSGIVREPGSERQLVLTLQAHFKDIFDHLLSRRFGKDGYAYLVNEKGLIIAHGDDRMIGKDVSGLNAIARVIGGGSGVAIDPCLSGDGFVKEAFLPVEPGRFGLVVARPMEEIHAFGRRLKRLNLAGFTAVAFSILAGVWMMSARTFTKPVQSLSRTMERIGRGDLDSPVETGSKDEFGQIARTFNGMLAELKTTTVSRDELERVVRERTAELEETNADLEREVAERVQTQKFSASILESMDEGLLVIDPSYRILDANRAFTRQVGRRREDVLGKFCYEVTHRYSRPCHEEGEVCIVARSFKTGKSHSCVHAHHSAQRKRQHIELKSYPIRDALGKVTKVIEVFNDVTEKMKLESQLRQAQKMEAIGRMAGEVAHDFNNYLAAIMGHAYVLKLEAQENESMRYNVEQVLATAELAAGTTQSLLAFSRKRILHPKLVDVKEMIGNIEMLLRKLLPEGIGLSLRLTGESLPVRVDVGQIEQAVVNLVVNARDALTRGGKIIIETDTVVISKGFGKGGQLAKEGRYALISVSDDGEGIPEDVKEQIFEPFFTTKGERDGTGLGLAITYGIVQQHGGVINVYSEVGNGSTFKVYLPLCLEEACGETEAEESPPPRGTGTIIFAEDDEKVRRPLATVLEESGYTVLQAADGKEAFRLFRDRHDEVAMLLLDVTMPEMNGKEVADEARKIDPEVKVLFTSGYTQNIIHKNGFLLSDIDFISKPVDPEKLLRQIAEIISRESGGSPV